MVIYTPYTYLIGWSNLNKWYYGVRFSKNCHPSDLWVTYFTSSKIVKEYRKIYGEPDIIKIRKTFNSPKKAQLWEHKVLKKLKVIKNENWLNKTDNISIDIECAIKGAKKKKSDKMKKLLSEANKGKKHSEETKKKISNKLKGKSGYWKNKKLSISTKQKLSEIGKTLIGDKNPFFGKKHSEETKRKISNSKKHNLINKKSL